MVVLNTLLRQKDFFSPVKTALLCYFVLVHKARDVGPM